MTRKKKGIILIGEDLDSFKNFYEAVSKEIFEPIFRDLPSDDEINKRIKGAIRKEEEESEE